MAWVITASVDPDKTTAPAVGSATAVFTDVDGTAFAFSIRASFTAANATAFVSAAIAARNAWQTQKTTEKNAITTLVNDFTAAGETATVGAVS